MQTPLHDDLVITSPRSAAELRKAAVELQKLKDEQDLSHIPDGKMK
jgi:hypothetical protein